MTTLRSLVVIFVMALATPLLYAQNLIYVRSGGNDANDGKGESTAKKTIAGALAVAYSEDVIDIGPGSFAGAPLTKGVVLQGANSSNALELWKEPTIITSTLQCNPQAVGSIITIVGLQFENIVPIGGRCENANITIYNCKFIGSKPIATSGSQWAEFFLTASSFDGKTPNAKPGTPLAASALSTGDVGIVVVRENTFKNYGKAAISASGAGQIVRLSYNEFTNCNATADIASGAIRVDASLVQQEVTIEHSLFTSCPTAVFMSGTLSSDGKTVTVQRNSFRQTPAGSVAIRNLSSQQLNATCNAFNVPTTDGKQPREDAAIAASITKLTAGPVTTKPTNLDATDVDGESIGYEPHKERGCSGLR